MAKYRAKAKIFVDNSLLSPGDEFSSENSPHLEMWEPLDDAAHAAIEAARTDAASRAEAIKVAVGSDGGSFDTGPLLARFAELSGEVSRLSGIASRVTELEALTQDVVRSADFGALAGRVEKAIADISELDEGVRLVGAETARTSATLAALAAAPPPPKPPEPVPEPEPVPVVDPVPEPVPEG